jgi:hypothetical protein
MGLLDFLKAAAMPAMAARSGYAEGQDQEVDHQAAVQRQSTMDKLKAAMDQSTIDENKSRGNYYDSMAAAKPTQGQLYGDAVQTRDGRYMRENKRTGEYEYVRIGKGAGGLGTPAEPSAMTKLKSAAGMDEMGDGGNLDDAPQGGDIAGSLAPKSVVAPSVKAPSTTSASTNAKTVASTDGAGSDDGYVYAPTKAEAKQYDTFTDASGKVWNRNTHDTNDVSPFMAGGKQVMGHVPREPRDPNAPPAMNTHVAETTAQSLAKSAVRAAGGDPVKAQKLMEGSTEYPKAKAAGMTMRHYYDAAAEYADEKKNTARQDKRLNYMIGDDPAPPPGLSTAPATPPAPSSPLATLKAAASAPPSSGNIDLRTPAPVTPKVIAPAAPDAPESGAPVSPATARASDAAKSEEVMRRIEGSRGAITPQQAIKSAALNENVKARIRAKYGLPPG